MIRALSPYYVETNLVYGSAVTCEKFTLNVWVWDGDKNTPDSTNSYQLTYKNTAERTDTQKINISPLVRDYMDFTQPNFLSAAEGTRVINGNNQQWVYTFVTYDDDTVTWYNQSTQLMTLGYSYGNQGENYVAVDNDTLLAPGQYKASKSELFVFPFKTKANASHISIKSYPNYEISFNDTLSSTDDSAESVKYALVDLNQVSSDTFVEIKWAGETTVLDITDECKYDPIHMQFQNKDGAIQSFTFFKDSKESMSVTSDQFQTNRGQAGSGYHQYVRFNVQGRTKVSASSGYISESENEVIKQLLLSERVWIVENYTYTPININTSSMTFKTRQRERLINYDITFEMSYNEINNI